MNRRALHLWPQVRPYAEPGRAQRAQWPWGITVATIAASALLAGCGGGSDEDDAAAHKGTQPVRCEWTAPRCV